MSIRLYWKKLGGHVHCRLFTAPAKYQTHGKAGNLVFAEGEWPMVRSAFESIGEVLEEGGD